MSDSTPDSQRSKRRFPTTRWSMVATATSADAESRVALVELCEAYWYPVYAYARRRGADPETAADRTQGFFTFLVEHHSSWQPDPTRGRFRSFLLASFNNYVSNDLRRERAAKRGGGTVPFALDLARAEGRYDAEPGHDETPERLYERHWSLTLLERALTRLGTEMEASGRGEKFRALEHFLVGHDGEPYRLVAEQLGMSEGAVKAAVHRLRHRFGQVLRDEVGETVPDPDLVADELHHLLQVLSQP